MLGDLTRDPYSTGGCRARTISFPSPLEKTEDGASSIEARFVLVSRECSLLVLLLDVCGAFQIVYGLLRV